jgi:hypothetical protein
MTLKSEPDPRRLSYRLFYVLGQAAGWIQSPFFFIRGFVRARRARKPK